MDYRLVASHVFANAHTDLPGVAPPHPAPASVLPVVGRPRVVATQSALSLGPAPAMTDGVTDLRLSAWSLVPLVTLILAECIHDGLFYTPPLLALPGWGKGKEEAPWPVPKGTRRTSGV